MQTFNIQYATFEDIVFEGKNKSYGAYQIRNQSNRSTLLALGISIAIFLLAAVTPRIISALSADEVVENTNPHGGTVILDPIPPLDKATPPPPIDIPARVKTVAYAAPRLKDNIAEDKTSVLDVVEAINNITSTIATDGEAKILIELKPSGDAVVPDPPKVLSFFTVEQRPSFPGGDGAFFKYLQDHITYPTLALENDIQGRVMVSFTVDENGAISHAKVVKGIGGGCDEEALKVIQAMPAWTPGKQNGRPVTVTHTLPVVFKLN